METLFDKYINKQVDKEDKELVKLKRLSLISVINYQPT